MRLSITNRHRACHKAVHCSTEKFITHLTGALQTAYQGSLAQNNVVSRLAFLWIHRCVDKKRAIKFATSRISRQNLDAVPRTFQTDNWLCFQSTSCCQLQDLKGSLKWSCLWSSTELRCQLGCYELPYYFVTLAQTIVSMPWLPAWGGQFKATQACKAVTVM